MKSCTITFRNENSIQDIIIDTKHTEEDTLEFKVLFNPPIDDNTDLGLAGQLCNLFCQSLANDE